MDGWRKVPGAAWQLLAQAQWEKLTKASFRWRLGKRGRLERVALEVEADGGEGKGSSVGSSGGRPRCFYESGEGAAALLSVLGRCHQLEDRVRDRVGASTGAPGVLSPLLPGCRFPRLQRDCCRSLGAAKRRLAGSSIACGRARRAPGQASRTSASLSRRGPKASSVQSRVHHVLKLAHA